MIRPITKCPCCEEDNILPYEATVDITPPCKVDIFGKLNTYSKFSAMYICPQCHCKYEINFTGVKATEFIEKLSKEGQNG